MVQKTDVVIRDITNDPAYKNLLIGCIFHRKNNPTIAHLASRNSERVEYLEKVIPLGFHMKILFHKDDYVGMIEYGPPAASGLPIQGQNITVMNCIWILRYAQGKNFGKLLLNDMITSEPKVNGFATLALENYWMVFMEKEMMQRLGFESIQSVTLQHKLHNKDQSFTVHLMWLPMKETSSLPTFDEEQLIKGIGFCNSHPIYWGRYGCKKIGLREIYKK